MLNDVQIKLSSTSECFLNLSSRSLQFTAPFFLTANSHDAPHVLSPRHSAGSFTGTRATWEAWKQTKYNKIHFKFIFQTGNNLIIYLQLGGYSGSKTCLFKSFVPHNSQIWEMTLMSISPLINVVDRWPCTTTTWTSIPVYQDKAWQLCPTSFGSCIVAARERHWMWGGKFWTSQNTLPWSWSSLEHVVNLWLSPWNIFQIWIICLQVMDIQRRFKKKTPTISLRCHSGSQHCATMMSLLQLDSYPRTK